MNAQKRTSSILYEIFICILAIISVIFSIIDIKSGLSPLQSNIDTGIWIFFLLDYSVKLFFSDNKKIFFKKNIPDFISILPFNSAFRIFRTFKLFRLLKFTKLTKLAKLIKLAKFFAVTGRILNKTKFFFNTNGFKYMVMLSSLLILIGGVCISFFENMTLSDGIWWSFVTATTVGYGDISPASSSGRIVACLLMISGIGLIGSLTSTITSFFMNSSESSSIDNSKIYMVFKLYNELTEEEKQEFQNLIG